MRVVLIHAAPADNEALTADITAPGHDVVSLSIHEGGWRRELRRRSDLVVVAGGDGAVGEVFQELAGSPFPVTIIPLGAQNNIADALGLQARSPAELVAAWPSFVLRPYDLGEASSPWGTRWFVETVGGGAFAETIGRVRTTNGDSSLHAALRLVHEHLESAQLQEWEIDLDGADLSGAFVVVEALNVRATGPLVVLSPFADPGDGLVDLVLVSGPDRDALLAHVEARLLREDGDPPRLPVYRGRELVLGPPSDTSLRVDNAVWPADGRRRRNGTVTVRAGHDQVTVLAPTPSKWLDSETVR